MELILVRSFESEVWGGGRGIPGRKKNSFSLLWTIASGGGQDSRLKDPQHPGFHIAIRTRPVPDSQPIRKQKFQSSISAKILAGIPAGILQRSVAIPLKWLQTSTYHQCKLSVSGWSQWRLQRLTQLVFGETEDKIFNQKTEREREREREREKT